jgi:hypothetical protein
VLAIEDGEAREMTPVEVAACRAAVEQTGRFDC